MSDLRLPAPAIDLVPHRNRMLLIDKLDEFSKNTGRAYLKISNKSLFIKNDGRLDSIVYAELLAQLIAAHSGYESKLDNAAPKVGFLVGLKDLYFHQSVLAGELIDMQIKKDYEFDQITYVSGKIFHDNALIAEGTLKLWEQSAGNFEPVFLKIDNQPIKKYLLTEQSANEIVNKMELNKAVSQNIYELNIAEDQSSVDAKLYFSNDFVGFDGHFPGEPLLPGIIIMKTGLLISEITLENRLCVKKIKHAKFAKSVYPNQEVNLNINLKEHNDSIQINAALKHEDQICAKYSIITKIEK